MAEESTTGTRVEVERRSTLRANAQAMVRDWLQGRPAAMERIGQRECGVSADAISRVARDGRSNAATSVLSRLQEAATVLTSPPATRPRWWRMAPQSRQGGPKTDLSAIIVGLETERDAIVRNLVSMQTTRRRVEEAEEALETSIHSIRSLCEVLQAARREVAGTADAQLAARLDDAERTLGERERAVLTQLTVSRQAVLALELLIMNETALQTALDDARNATVSALRLAETARDASSVAKLIAEAPSESGKRTANGIGDWQHAREAIGNAMTRVRSLDETGS